MKLEIDAEQVAKEVKERNRLYKALLEIRDIVSSEQNNSDSENRQVLSEILNKCDKALSGII